LKKVIFLIILFFHFITGYSYTKNKDIELTFQKFVKYYSAGDLVNAEDVLLSALGSKEPILEGDMVAIYTNLGVINTIMGKYEKALDYSNKAEALIELKNQKSQSLADIYNNKAFIYNVQKSFDLAIEYLEKSIRIYLTLNTADKSMLQSLSSAYLNIGIAYLEIKDYKSALHYFEKSAELKKRNKLSGIQLVYLNIAKTFVKTEHNNEAEKYFLLSLDEFSKEFGPDYYRTTSVLFDYGLFLRSVGRNKEALAAHRKALTICLKNYGEKHTLVSLAYKHLGDHYLFQNCCDTALYYYQKSLIAVVKDFNDSDVFTNPSIDSAIFDIRLLDDLKSKAVALEHLADQLIDPGKKLRTAKKSLETIELALQLIDRIRNDYLTQESRIYLAENEKETYLFATQLAYSLYTLTKNDQEGFKVYDIAKKAKASILRNEISENETLYSAGIPDSLQKKQNSLSANSSAYYNLILEELRKKDPDNRKVALWKDAIFEMNREKEMVADQIIRDFPQYHDLLQKTSPVNLGDLRKQLGKGETVVDYLLSNQYSEGKRKLFIFLISKDRLQICENDLDSFFVKSADIIREFPLHIQTYGKSDDLFRNYTSALFYMYENLIKPVEGMLSGNKLIIIPDEEIAWLPFDAFLKSKPDPEQTDYEGLQYLISYYTFSYGYSSSLIFSKKQIIKGVVNIYAFSPDYGSSHPSGQGTDYLHGTGNEIDTILRLFKGKKFAGNEATESNFRKAINNQAIFHLAMHSLSDSVNSRYSFMMFDRGSDSINDGKLYNYEISVSRIMSPMVVLSTCNSGTGTLYHGEGLMSLARGFMLAGASSVIKTAWEVNDEAGAEIITRFYYYLSKGKQKDEAMRLSKLEFLKTNPPLYANPFYWAAYEVLGDSSAVAPKNHKLSLIILILIMILITAYLQIYFKRCRSFSDRS
jgi:CHAT domain-containing protein